MRGTYGYSHDFTVPLKRGRLGAAKRRIRLAAWLAWNALRGRAAELEVGDLDGATRFTGVAHPRTKRAKGHYHRLRSGSGMRYCTRLHDDGAGLGSTE